MVSKYPAHIDTSVTVPAVTDNLTPVSGGIFNKLRDAVLAVESELGVLPSATYSTVRARIDALEEIIGNLKIIELANDLGGTLDLPKVIGIQGRPVTTAEPSYNDILTWNGIAWVYSTATQGSLGPMGATGPAGPVGPTGATGPAGADGVDGANGADGYDGIDGEGGLLALALTGVAGQETTNLTGLVSIGTIVIDPTTYFSGLATYTIEFQATIETTDTSATANIRLYNIDTGKVVDNSLLTSTSTSPENIKQLLTVGVGDGEIHETEQTYEVQLYRTGGDANMFVTCRQAQLILTRTS